MKCWQILGYLGLLPFPFFLWLGSQPTKVETLWITLEPEQNFIFYSAIILSFLAGTLWKKDTLKQQKNTQVISNVFCLYAFFCLLIMPALSLTFLAVGYLGLFLTEYILCYNKEYAYTSSYLVMRLILTILLILLHGFAIFLWFAT